MIANDSRCRKANDRPVDLGGRYVLYWMQVVRRLHANHALDRALRWCRELQKPLVVYEAVKLDYPWASARHHTFMLEGMRDNAAAAKRLGIAYWPFVEAPDQPGRGLLAQLAQDACIVLTDDYPAYIVPAHNRALGARSNVAVHLVDGNGIVPLNLLGKAVSAAAHLRPRIHTLFAQSWADRANVVPHVPSSAKATLDPPFTPWNPQADLSRFVDSLPIDRTVPAVAGKPGGTEAGRRVLDDFLAAKLRKYAEGRNRPDDPDRTAASHLSPYLRYGHIGIQEVVSGALGEEWTTAEINHKAKGKRDDFFCGDPNVNGFLDEAITWRDVGYHWHFARNVQCLSGSNETTNRSWQIAEAVPQFNFETFDFSPGGERTLDVVLPEWAQATLRKHGSDQRSHLYELEEFEAAATHDDLWNAAQRELVATGRIHNYLRMLWGKKVLEWSETPAAAYRVLEHLNNKYAIDGRDPNSYTGILWCFGLFDRPWPPERQVFGSIRYMSSASTAKKFKLAGYLDYIGQLPTVEDVWAGKTAVAATKLF